MHWLHRPGGYVHLYIPSVSGVYNFTEELLMGKSHTVECKYMSVYVFLTFIEMLNTNAFFFGGLTFLLSGDK